jgi:DNA topoisomerase VI subunit B
MHRHLERALALVADHDIHLGRLADEARDRPRRPRGDLRDHAAHAPATDLLVIGERQMQRLLQRRAEHVRHCRKAARHIALHVGRSAAVELAVAFGELER